jgi:hypothetical protein
MSSPCILAFTGLRSQEGCAAVYLPSLRLGFALAHRLEFRATGAGNAECARPWAVVASEGRNCGGIPECRSISPLTRAYWQSLGGDSA